MTDITVLDHLLVVNLDIHIWTARKKLVPLDLGGAELPPEDLASLGSKRVCNPEDLRSFTTLKAWAVSVLERSGIRFLSGWAVPDTRIDDIMRELAVIRDGFKAAKGSFLQRYEQSVDCQASAMGQHHRRFHGQRGVCAFQTGFSLAGVSGGAAGSGRPQHG